MKWSLKCFSSLASLSALKLILLCNTLLSKRIRLASPKLASPVHNSLISVVPRILWTSSFIPCLFHVYSIFVLYSTFIPCFIPRSFHVCSLFHFYAFFTPCLFHVCSIFVLYSTFIPCFIPRLKHVCSLFHFYSMFYSQATWWCVFGSCSICSTRRFTTEHSAVGGPTGIYINIEFNNLRKLVQIVLWIFELNGSKGTLYILLYIPESPFLIL